MPRKRSADRIGPLKTRSRSGCQQCRSSKVKCDERLPHCTRCWERGLLCQRGVSLKWESEYLSRGLTFGRAGVWKKGQDQNGEFAADSSISSTSPTLSTTTLYSDECHEWLPVPRVYGWSFINADYATFEQPRAVSIPTSPLTCQIDRSKDEGVDDDAGLVTVYQPVKHGCSVMVKCSERPRRSLSIFPELSGTKHAQLFDYYFQAVCPRTTPSQKEASPFAALILPFSTVASQTLLKAIQALGACHWSKSDSKLSAVGLRFKSAVLKELRHKLATEGPLKCSMDTEILVIMMMLCLYEIVDDCDQRWTVHLRGAKDLVAFRRQRESMWPSPSIRGELDSFSEAFFAFQDIIGRTACGETAVFGADYWRGDEQQINVWMGCSPELVSILSMITELSRSRRRNMSDDDGSSFFLPAASLENRLDHLQQLAADPTDITLIAAADLKRQAAILYLHCALYGASPSTSLVIQLVCEILNRVSELIDQGIVASMTWPVFVAAVELDPLNDDIGTDSNGIPISGRALVLRALEAMAGSAVTNVTRTRVVISKVWQMRDMNTAGTSLHDLEGDTSDLNDWERYVAPVSNAMSLA
ncbi:transcriptional regulator family: Fungal Specific TF [Paecilomyces variotii]|nr:transcriptional regulator family: Fungal Specific TF [Paecilomyces variotii]